MATVKKIPDKLKVYDLPVHVTQRTKLAKEVPNSVLPDAVVSTSNPMSITVGTFKFNLALNLF